MPYEMRRLYFSEDEVTRAILAFNAQSRQKFLSPGSLAGIALRDDPSLGIEVRIETVEGTIETVLLNEVLVGAAIIRFCIDTHVPLPLHGTKSLKLCNGRIVLDVSMAQERGTLAAGLHPAIAAAG